MMPSRIAGMIANPASGLIAPASRPAAQHHAVRYHQEHRPRVRVHAEGHRDDRPMIANLTNTMVTTERLCKRGQESRDHAARERRQ